MTERSSVGVLVGSWPKGMPTDPTRFYADLVRQVEQDGFDTLFVGDHLFAAGPSVDALALASYFAARSTRLRIGTGVLQLALREPVAAAKQIATIDMLSGGRFVLGVGVGGEFADEWAAVGVPRATRGRRLDEYLDLAGKLWSGERVGYQGRFASVDGVVGSPLPTRPPGPPVWVGGRSDAALERAVRNDGWLAYACSTRRVRESVARLEELGASAAGRDFRIGVVLWTYASSSVEQARERIAEILGARYRQDFDHFVNAFCAIGTAEDIAARVEEFRSAGVTDVLLSPQCPADEFLDQVSGLAPLVQSRIPDRTAVVA